MWIRETLEKLQIPFREVDMLDLEMWEGQMLNATQFFGSEEEMRAHLSPWIPIYFLPIAIEGPMLLGLHLSPENISSHKLAIAEIQEIGGRSACIEIAPSLRAYIYGYLMEYGDDEMIEQVNAAFGEDFFEDGRHTEDGTYTTPREWPAYISDVIMSLFGPSPYQYERIGYHFVRKDPAKALSIYERGIEDFALNFHLFAQLAKIYDGNDDFLRAAQTYARSLQTERYTAYLTIPQTYYQLGQKLLNQVPEAFSPEERADLETTDPVERFKQIVALDRQGEYAVALKRLNDWCYDAQDYHWSQTLVVFRWHAERLGWTWLVNLCDLRPANPVREPRFTVPVSEWDAIVRQIFKF